MLWTKYYHYLLLSSTFSIISGNLAIANDINSNLMSTIKNDNEINFLATADINAVENFLVGFKFIYEELIKALSKEGLKEISAIA